MNKDMVLMKDITQMDRAMKLYKKMYAIRLFEREVEKLFGEGKLFGTTHACIGQEGIAVGVINCIEKGDYIISNHRGHGHYLAYTEDYKGLFGELMGRETGVVGGRGGSQHLHHDRFFSNGVLGGMCPFAVGLGLSIKKRKENSIVLCFIGDGTFGQGILYESLNLASILSSPVLFIVENNQYAMSTHVKHAISGSFEDKARAFDIENLRVKTGNIFEIIRASNDAICYCRNEKKPGMLIFDTYRFCGHSKSDDLCYRDKEEEKEWREMDPVCFLEKVIDDRKLAELRKDATGEIEAARAEAMKAVYPDITG